MESNPIENFRYLSVSIGIAVSVTGTVGNLLAIFAYALNSKIRTSFNLLVVNLAVVDCLISISILPIVTDGYLNMKWRFSCASCTALAYFYHAAFFTSAMFLVIISFNRYMHVSYPHTLYSKMFSKTRRSIMVGVTWLFSPICLLPLLFESGFSWSNVAFLCTFSRGSDFAREYSLFLRILFQFLPLLLMIVIYGLIIRSVKKSHASVHRVTTSAHRCESLYYSTDTNGTTTTPLGTPTSLSGKRNYQLRLGSSSSPNSKSPRSPYNFDFLPNGGSTSPLAQKHKSSQEKQRNAVRRSQTENSSDFKTATLRRQTANLKYAAIRRSSSVIENVRKCPQSVPYTRKGFEQKQRSATYANFTTLVEPSFSSQSLNVEKPPSPKTREAKSNIYQQQRPRNLSLTPDRFVNKPPSPRSLSRKANLSLPNLRRPSLSASFNGIKDLFSPQTRRRETRRSIRHAKAQRKLLSMCIVICSAFAICSLPSLVVNIIDEGVGLPPEVHILTTNLRWLTSFINPIVYAAMNKQFRKEYSRMLERVTKFFCKSTEITKKKPLTLPTIQVSETFVRR